MEMKKKFTKAIEKNMTQPRLNCRSCNHRNHEILELRSVKKLNFQSIYF